MSRVARHHLLRLAEEWGTLSQHDLIRILNAVRREVLLLPKRGPDFQHLKDYIPDPDQITHGGYGARERMEPPPEPEPEPEHAFPIFRPGVALNPHSSMVSYASVASYLPRTTRAGAARRAKAMLAAQAAPPVMPEGFEMPSHPVPSGSTLSQMTSNVIVID